MSKFRFLYFGDVVGTPGVKTLERLLPLLKTALAADAAFANAENAAPGNGLTPAVAARLYKAGADALTLGNHTWKRPELKAYLPQDSRLARPANGTKAWPGKGYARFESPVATVYLINLLGQVFLQTPQSPFTIVDELLQVLSPTVAAASHAVAGDSVAVSRSAEVLAAKPRPSLVIVDMHAEATAEKTVMGQYLDGRVAAVVGTHTHVATADARVLPGGTAYITDLGMCGPTAGVIGMDSSIAKRRLVDGLPSRYEVAKGPTALSGVMVDYDLTAAAATAIYLLNIPGHLSKHNLPALLAEQTQEEAAVVACRLGLSRGVCPGAAAPQSSYKQLTTPQLDPVRATILEPKEKEI